MQIAIWASVCVVLIIALAVIGRRDARQLVRERGIRVDRFKLKSRHARIAEQVFAAEEVRTAIAAYASANDVTIAAAERTAQLYLHEILPKFNLLAYYRFGAPLAKVILNFLYRVVVGRKTLRDFSEDAPKGAVVVYVINHRSNADYVLVAHMLFKFVSLSYAVGEWARVWPLNHLFKWFGAYFIRRRFREPLYHAVLSEFVRTITKNGVTQGFFIEGGLTRDGAFQKPKLGMLDYIVSSKRDPRFTAPLYLIPTAINYDRVLEDRNLTDELLGREERATRWEKFSTTMQFLFKNSLRSFVGRFKRYGYAVVAFGEPILVDDYARADARLLAATFEDRKPAMQHLADEIMRSISGALPVTPVTIVAKIFAEREGGVRDAEMLQAIARYRDEQRSRTWLLREKTPEELWGAARKVLELRRLIALDGERWHWSGDALLLRDYYANSLRTYDDVKLRGWSEKAPRSA